MHSLLSGQQYRRVGNQAGKGPEWAGPCPVCGGGEKRDSDRFHIWPEQGTGTFWCRRCDKGGDLVEFYRWAEGLSYRDACAKAGVEPNRVDQHGPPAVPRARRPAAFEPRPSVLPVTAWADHAAKFADWCHLQLLNNAEQLAWLAARGIDAGSIARYCLGWNPTDAWRQREAWALATERKADGKPKKLWLPKGLVIPQLIDGRVARLRIRRPEGEPKYYVVPGSGREPFVSRHALAYVLVEAELDAICLDAAAGDLAGAIAMGNDSAKPTERLWALLEGALHVSVSLDSDTPRLNGRTGRMESPGADSSRWWTANLPLAERVPMIGGKDPGDAYKAGIDLRAWVLAGLPPRFQLRARKAQAESVAPQALLVADPQQLPEVMAEEQQGPKHHILTLASGQEIHLTDDRALWEELSDAGLVVFSEQEMVRLQAACATMSEEERTEAVARVVDMKIVFPGAYVRRGEAIQ